MPTQPAQSRTAELLTQINGLTSKDRHDAFLLKQLERDARKVLTAGDYAGGYTLLGALAAVRQDLTEVRANHEAAVRIAPREPYVLRNYAISLNKVGAFDEAISMAERAWSLDKSSLENLFMVVNFAYSMGRMSEAAGRIRDANQAFRDYAASLSQLHQAATVLADQGISDDASGAIARAALQVAPPQSVAAVVSRVESDDETTWVDFALALNESTERISELNKELVGRMAELSLDTEISRAASAFVVRFTSSATLDARNTL